MINKFKNIFQGTGGQVITDLVNPYKLEIDRKEFVNFKTAVLYQKILKRCYAKSKGLTDVEAQNLWDSVELGNAQYGIISMIADAMTKKKELILVNDSGIVRVADINEAEEIKKDYAERAESSKGVYMNFQKYTLTDIIKIYMDLVFDIMGGVKVNLGIGKALQYKIADMRKLIGASSSEDPSAVAKAVVEALKNGKSVAIDGQDNILTTPLQTAPVVEGMKLIYGLLASELGVSTSFVAGELTSGMAVTGEADVNANEEGIKDFFISVYKPVISKLFNKKIEFRSDNWRKLTQYASVIPYIESSLYMDEEQKKKFFNFIFEEE